MFDDSFLVDVCWRIGYGLEGNGGGLPFGFIVGPSEAPLALTGGIRVGWVFKIKTGLKTYSSIQHLLVLIV